MWALSLLAVDDPLQRPEIIFGIVGLIAALLAGAVVISLTDKWRKRAMAPTHDETDVLTTYRDMYEHGEITEVEYAELRRKIAEKVKSAPASVPSAAATDPTGRPDPAKFVVPAPPAPGAKLDPPAPSTPPPEPPAPPGTS